jgi:hypothetical protein
MPLKTKDLADLINRDLSGLARTPNSIATISRLSEQVANVRYPILQDRWLQELGGLGALQNVVNSTAAEQISQLVASSTFINATSAIERALADLPGITIRQVLDTSLGRLTSAIGQATTVGLMDWANRFQARMQRDADAQIRRRGWYTLPSWTDEQLFMLAGHAGEEGNQAFTKRLCAMYRRNRLRELRRMVNSWMDLESFRDRRAIIQEALASHRDRRYRVAIPALLPLIEGIVKEEFPVPGPTRKRERVPERVRKLLAEVVELDAIETAATLVALDALYGDYDRLLTRRSRSLNRHGILHGAMLSYGSEGNSLRAFGILDLLHSQALTRRELKAA